MQPPGGTGAAEMAIGLGSHGLSMEAGMTFGYFIPTPIDLMTEGVYSRSEAAVKALEWARLANVRHVADAICLMAAMKAFSMW